MTHHSLFSRMRPALAAGAACLLGLASTPSVWAAIRPDPARGQVDSQAFFNQMSTEPLRYGGLASVQNHRILVGLHPTGPGRVAGEMMRLDATLRPLDAGPVTGTLTPASSTQLARCHLKITLPDRDLLLDGPCSGSLLSGALTTRPKPGQLWSQVSNFISPDTSVSQYWLSRDAWQAAITPAPARQGTTHPG